MRLAPTQKMKMKWFRDYTSYYVDLNNLVKGVALIKQRIYCDIWLLYQTYATAKWLIPKYVDECKAIEKVYHLDILIRMY